ncbi:MAG: methyltransferase [Bacteroidetes bacterium]|nr:methyltransferase [Bacteroidota bacterium]
MSELKCNKGETSENLDANFWNELWKSNITGWDLKAVSPPLKAYFDTMTCKNKSILIPGCGNAYEAEYLLEQGFRNITIIDISSALVQQLLSKYVEHIGKELTIICGDFFKHTGKYDFIIEQTFFCALKPNKRVEYVEKMQSLLNENGKLAGVLFNKTFENSPPYGGDKQAYIQLFSTYFNIDRMEECTNSVKPRLGTELFFELSLK